MRRMRERGRLRWRRALLGGGPGRAGRGVVGVRRWVVWGVVVSVLLLAGCASGGSGSAPAVPGPSLRAPSQVVVSADAGGRVRAAVAAYLGLLRAFTEASNAGVTAEGGGLGRFATGSALRLLAGGLAENRARGVRTRGAPVVEVPRVVEVAPLAVPVSVSVVGCVDDGGWPLYTVAGRWVDSGPSGRRRTSARVVDMGGVWKVSELAVGAVGTCAR